MYGAGKIVFDILYGTRKLFQEQRVREDGSVEFWGWSEDYDRDGAMTRRTEKTLLSTMLFH